MSSDVLDRILRRLGSAPLAELGSRRDVVKVDLQNVNDHLAQRYTGTGEFMLANAQLGAVMWPWKQTVAFWRSTGHGAANVADFAALVDAGDEQRCYTALLFRLRPQRETVEFMGWGGVLCRPDGSLQARDTAASVSEAIVVYHLHRARELLDLPPLTDAQVPLAIEGMRSARETSSYLTTMLVFAARFANCRNVVQLERASVDSTPKPWLRSGHPRYSYRVLGIDPDALRVRKASAPPTGRHGVSLHICRGHFATYTAERPLFGRYTGTYWIPQHARGDAAVGYAEKSYAIHRPAAAESGAAGAAR